MQPVCDCLSARELQLRTFLAAALLGNPEGFVDWFGILCSSWVSTSRGTTRRSYVCPDGYVEYRSVMAGNVMASRFLDSNKGVFKL